MRQLILIVITFCLVSACNYTFSPEPTKPNTSALVSDCRVVEHIMDETCVPRHPQRVVTLGDVGNALALGIKPVGSYLPQDIHSYLKDKITDIKNVGSYGEANLETILALKPDLILADYPYYEKVYNQLMQIAPTVLIEHESSQQWKSVLKKEAEALGKLEQAEQLIAEYYARLEQFKAEMGNRLNQLEVSVVRLYHTGEILLYTTDGFVATILKDASLRYPAAHDQYPNGSLSKERIRDIDADVLFLWTYGSTPAIAQQVRTDLEKLKVDPLWLQLNAVQEGKVYDVPSYWAGDSILAANAVIDDLFKYLVEEQ